VGIVVLNYHNPVETLACVQQLISREPGTSRVLWVENDADATLEEALEVLRGSGLPFVLIEPSSPSLPPTGTLGVIFNHENLGYGGGNNVGLRLLHQLKVPFAWVLNNDTLLQHGTSDALVRAAETRPEVGAWGTPILTKHTPCYFGGIVSKRNFSIQFAQSPECLETDPLSYVSGCSLFMRTAVAAQVGFLPEQFFLYYEDPAFGLELRKAGYVLSGIWDVVVYHIESLSTGRRSKLMEFYNRRNRWHFIKAYFPEDLDRQKRQLWYHIQKYLFRGNIPRAKLEWDAFRDFKAGRLGPLHPSPHPSLRDRIKRLLA
jgi:GT2 family glycosyltransferase